MFGIAVHTEFDAKRVEKAVKDASFKSLGHAAASIRLTARRSIRRRKKPSSPGAPPHTREGRLKKAIVYAVERREERAVIGPSYRVVGPVGMAHEFGGKFRGQVYPRRHRLDLP
jgi:hypothetical protein